MNAPISEAELRHIAATRAPDGVKELLLEAADLTARRIRERQATEQDSGPVSDVGGAAA